MCWRRWASRFCRDNRIAIGYSTLHFAPDYRSDRTLNLGGNRWSFDTQVGYSQAIGRQFWFDAAADAILYTLNHDAGPGHGTLAQQPSYETQIWFSYLPGIRTSISVGAAVHWGGAQSINQVSNGLKTEVEQIRATFWYAVTSAIQLSVLLSPRCSRRRADTRK